MANHQRSDHPDITVKSSNRTFLKLPISHRQKSTRSSLAQLGQYLGHQHLRFFLNPPEMLLASKTLRVELVHVLGP